MKQQILPSCFSFSEEIISDLICKKQNLPQLYYGYISYSLSLAYLMTLLDFFHITYRFYLLTFTMVLAILFSVLSVLYNFRRFDPLKSKEYFLEMILLSFASIVVISLYFFLKTLSSCKPPSSFIPEIESPLWHVLIFKVIDLVKREHTVSALLDFIYIPCWFLFCVVPFVCIFDTRKSYRRAFFVAMWFCYLVSGILYVVCPTLSPVYVFQDAFNDFELKYSSFLHKHSLAIYQVLQESCSLLLVVEKFGYPVQPVAAFPSFHVALVVLVLMYVSSFRKNQIIFIACFIVGFLFSVSAVILGFHWISDVVAGSVEGYISWKICTCLFNGQVFRFLNSNLIKKLKKPGIKEERL